jgi:membrane protein DedA with SNARE-associated domain
MEALLELIMRHGALFLGAWCFLEAVGLPLPAAFALMAAGALTRQGDLSALVFFAGIGALLAGDLLLYALGRLSGWWLLGVLCRLAMNPESCIYNAAHGFYRKGRQALLFAKFLPGVNTMAAPLAGSLQMRPLEFLAFDSAGVLIYAGTYFGLGFLFSGFLKSIAEALVQAGRFVEMLVLGAVIGYLAYRVWMAWRLRSDFFDIPRISAAELARAAAEAQDDMVIIDVRSHGYYGEGAERIKGSIRVEPNRLTEALHELPNDKKIYLYCT